MASDQSNVYWQTTKVTVLARNCHMFNNADMSDITFTCKESNKKFYAHKYVLCTSSCVFRAMFYGGLANTNSSIHFDDIEESSFEQFLRFLYSEECDLTTDNVAAVLYLAKKFIVPSLNTLCNEFLLENLIPTNALDVLAIATNFDETELEMHCWRLIKAKTKKVVASDTFKNVSKTTLVKLLKHDRLNMSEIDLFQAVLKWIDMQCSIMNLEPTAENRRFVIGEGVYEFRFFSMSQTDFVEHVVFSGVLTSKELSFFYKKFMGVDSPALGLNQMKRKRQSKFRFSRYCNEEEQNDMEWCGGGPHPDPDRLCVSVNKDVFLLGVRLFAHYYTHETYDVTFEVKDIMINEVFSSKPDKNNIFGFDVYLKTPLFLEKDEVVTLSASLTGIDFELPNSAGNPLDSVELEGITVTFSDASKPNNGTSTQKGQFHEIILSI